MYTRWERRRCPGCCATSAVAVRGSGSRSCRTPPRDCWAGCARATSTAGFAPRIAFEGEEVGTARGLISAGLGLSLLPATASSLADPAVVAVPVTEPRAVRLVALAWPADRPLTAPAAAFRDFALSYADRLLR